MMIHKCLVMGSLMNLQGVTMQLKVLLVRISHRLLRVSLGRDVQ
jgi:hypothetical protein